MVDPGLQVVANTRGIRHRVFGVGRKNDCVGFPTLTLNLNLNLNS